MSLRGKGREWVKSKLKERAEIKQIEKEAYNKALREEKARYAKQKARERAKMAAMPRMERAKRRIGGLQKAYKKAAKDYGGFSSSDDRPSWMGPSPFSGKKKRKNPKKSRGKTIIIKV